MTDATPVRSLDTDWLLDLLTSMANAGDFSLGITLWTKAGIVSGDLIGAVTWVRELRQQVRDAGSPVFAGDLASVEEHLTRQAEAAALAPEPLSFLHLRGATTLLQSGETFSHDLWRGRFVDVTGWTLGRL